MEIVNFSLPNKEQLARGAAVNLLFRFGMQTAKPFKVSHNSDANFAAIKNELEGRPWLTTLALKSGNKEFTFIECIISINQEKNIVTTALQGWNGTIKEYISDGDYSISVYAAVNNYVEGDDTGASFEYPEEQLEQLIKILNEPVALDCHSDFLKMFNIDSVVVKSYDLQQETHSNRQAINIQLLSDKPYQIRIKEEDAEA